MTQKAPLVSIVIPTHNRKDMLARLLKSILKNSYKNVEIIVVDDFSSDGTIEYFEKKYLTNSPVRFIRNKSSLYTAQSRNKGAKIAKGEYIFFIDDDNVLDEKAIGLLVESFRQDKLLGEAGPVNYSFDNKKRILWAKTKRNMWTSFTHQSRSLKEFGKLLSWETDDIPNAFMIRSELFKKKEIIFDSKYGIMYEESDFAYRIKKAGFQIRVTRAAKIFHDTENSSKGDKMKNYMFHFMNDKRRPFVFARNRIVFHTTYSSTLQLVSILSMWVWFFTILYSYKILSYSGAGEFGFFYRISLVIEYIRGNFVGLRLISQNKIYEKNS